MKSLLTILSFIACSSFGVFAEIKPFALFCDNAVLQRDRPIHIFGTGTDGDEVRVEFNNAAKSTVVKNGRWRVDYPAMTAGGPYTLKISGGGNDEPWTFLILQ